MFSASVTVGKVALTGTTLPAKAFSAFGTTGV